MVVVGNGRRVDVEVEEAMVEVQVMVMVVTGGGGGRGFAGWSDGRERERREQSLGSPDSKQAIKCSKYDDVMQGVEGWKPE